MIWIFLCGIKAPHYWPFVKGIHLSTVVSPHKLPVMWKSFPCHDLSMLRLTWWKFQSMIYVYIIIMILSPSWTSENGGTGTFGKKNVWMAILKLALDSSLWQNWTVHYNLSLQERWNSIANALELRLFCTKQLDSLYIEGNQWRYVHSENIVIYFP